MLDAEAQRHAEADAIWQRLLAGEEALLTTSYVLVETFALVQRRLGMEAVHAIEREIFPLLHLRWVDAELHRAAVDAWLEASRRRLSLVDCASFAVMRQLDLRQVFAFDGHFEEQGFEVLQA